MMESILARALEYTLKYWLKSFSRDQFKLQGRTVQLSKLDINGDVLHASLGLPPAINVATAKIGKLEIKLPYVSNVQVEPIVVQIDKLDLVLEENADPDSNRSSSSGTSTTGSGKGSGYGFADKIADGMTLEVGTVNLMLETRGGASQQGGAAWASPLASFTVRNLLLYTTNEHWQVVNLKEARDFSNEEKFIYVFKKLEWESLSVDLLPHPDMFTEMDRAFSASGDKKRDNDGAKRVFFGGERFLEGISGQAYITVQRDELNSPLGLEVQLHVTEAVCPALSEPGLRALLRFMTGLYVCLNRGDVDPKAQQGSAEAAGRSLVSFLVDHIFLCIKDSEFQLDLLMQSLFFSRASVSDGESTKNLTHVTITGMFLRDTFSRPPCTLVQPSMQDSSGDSPTIPNFVRDFCPPIYPLGDEGRKLDDGVPLICLYTLQIKPSPQPPLLASETVIFCQPLVINLQEESCLRITSFLADGVVVNPGVVLPDFSVNSLKFTLKEFDLIVPLSFPDQYSFSSFSGAKLHVENFLISETPAIKFQLLNLEKDPACFCLWDGQPVDSSQRKWAVQVSYLSLSLETSSSLKESLNDSRGSWHCVELHEGCFEAAMLTSDGSPLITTPPSGGIVRIGFACEQYLSNTSTEQLFFILDLYAYFGRISEKIGKVRKGSKINILEGSPESGLLENAPSDTAVSLAIGDLQLKFIEPSSADVQGIPLVHFGGEDLFVKVTHRTLGGAIAVSSSLCWKSVHVDCVTTEVTNGNDIMGVMPNGFPHMRAVFWIDHRGSSTPFLDISTVHVMPSHAKDVECHSLTLSARLAGVRLGGGMNYTEALLHRFGILGPDGGPGEGLSKGLKNLSAGPLSKFLKASPLVAIDGGEGDSLRNGEQHPHLELGKPDDVDIGIELRDWSFALEEVNEMEGYLASNRKQVDREEKSWHTTFHSLQIKAKSNPIETNLSSRNSLHGKKYPVELVTVSVEGLQAFKPRNMSDIFQNDCKSKNMNGVTDRCGVNLEAHVLSSGQDENQEISQWVVEKIKFSVKQPIEAVATKDEIQHLAVLCRSEIESMGRIAAGIIRILDLDKSIGQAALDQLSSLGNDGVDKIFTPEKPSRRSSIGSTGYTPALKPREGLEETIKLLEAAVSDSQAKCSALTSQLDGIDNSVLGVDELKQRIESMHDLLMKLRTQV